MALINSKGNYIKLNEDGYYSVYTSELARKRLKESTAGEIILAKYRESLEELEQQHEFKYYDPKGFAAIYNPWAEEYQKYQYNFDKHVIRQEYPLMAKIYSDIADSIPEIIEAGYIPYANKDIKELYREVKQLKIFGETIDA